MQLFAAVTTFRLSEVFLVEMDWLPTATVVKNIGSLQCITSLAFALFIIQHRV